MKNLNRFNEFLFESEEEKKSIGAFATKFIERINKFEKLGKAKEEEKKDYPSTGFDQKTGDEFRKWMSENYPDFKDESDNKLDYDKKGKAKYKPDNTTIREAYSKYGEKWKKSKEKDKK